ncbi:hypothetical protein K469DRAFT_681747 [Zopfia rhizophila CBS 207.26]|uniref:Inheritance of peroxisomes protein 1 n=1 Tax=Zopfia rhizophila CBS 207.26 TaxID=1314779 RepID=A0A6A6EWN9_9PEZI|nr:hypothetical protein K469DRAFT_681747 [Zopfia rhizophila CBS 207.26]
MSSPTASRTPEHAPQPSNPNIRRSFTLPARVSNRPKPPSTSTSSTDGIETLFTHISTKIVSFTASTGTRQPSLSPSTGVDLGVDIPGYIPWRSYTERTLAAGVLRIYRVTSSNVSFLNSGSLLHTIFPKSQCWCVDGESKFVLRIRQDLYYRIELPYESDEDKEKIEAFKVVLDQVLRYEKTQCPFTRGFEVELPEAPKSPVRRRPRKPPEKAKKWLFDKTWVPEDGPRPATPVPEGSDSGTTSSYEEDDRSSVHTTGANEDVPASPVTLLETTPPKAPQALPVSERAKIFQGRSVTAPSGMGWGPPLASHAPEVPKPRADSFYAEQEIVETSPSADTMSLMSSADSFYSLETTAQRSPTPPYMDAEAIIEDNPWVQEHGLQKEQKTEDQDTESSRGRGRHRRQISEVTVTAPSPERVEEPYPHTPTIDVHPASAPSTPPLISDSDDSLEPPFLDVPTPPDTIRLKRLTGASQRRAFSPMPQPQNIFFPPAPGPRKQFTATLVRKTCEIILGPPAHLVSLMLRIAAKISAGAFNFNTYRVRNTGEKIPCSWESSDEGEWAEDDFGIPLGNLEGSSSLRRRERGWSSGVD